MKKFGQYLGVGLLAMFLCISMAHATDFWNPVPIAPAQGNADGMAAYTGSVAYDQGIYDQQVKQLSFDVTKSETSNVTKKSFGAFHEGPFVEGKAFDNFDLTYTKAKSCTVTIAELKAQLQGMNGAMDFNQQAAAGACAKDNAYTTAVAGGDLAVAQAQYRTYNLNGTKGAGVQVAAGTSHVEVVTKAGKY